MDLTILKKLNPQVDHKIQILAKHISLGMLCFSIQNNVIRPSDFECPLKIAQPWDSRGFYFSVENTQAECMEL